jgi:outer membrane protein assembly factor BamB
MRRVLRSTGVRMTIVLALATGFAGAQDWPQWRGAGRDGKAAGFTAPAKWPGALVQKWSVKVGTGDATPVLVGDKLYVFTREGNQEVVRCLALADGKEAWKYAYDAQPVSGPGGSHPGPRSSPAVAAGKVVTMGVAGVVACVDAASGKELWRRDEMPKVVPQFFAAVSPIIVDGAAAAFVGGKGNGALIAFDLATGAQKWKWAGDAPPYGSPVLATIEGVAQLVVIGEKTLTALAVADGKVLWQADASVQGRASNAATPIVDGATVYLTGQGRGIKALKIEKQGEAFATKEVWTNADANVSFNTPVLKDGFLYGLTGVGNLFCVDAKTGKTAWTDTAKHSGFGSIVDAGAVMFAQLEKNGLIAFAPNGAKYEELARLKVATTDVYAHTIVAGNRLIVKDKETVALWTIQ